MTQVTKEEVQKMIDEAIRKHNFHATIISAILGFYVGSGDKFIPLNTFEINLANVASRQQLQSGLPGELGDASKALMVSQRDAERLYSQYSQSAHRYILDHWSERVLVSSGLRLAAIALVTAAGEIDKEATVLSIYYYMSSLFTL